MGEASLKKLVEINDVITLSVKTGLPVIASLNNMTGDIWQEVSGLARQNKNQS